MIIDTHTHLDDESYFDDIDNVIKDAKGEGISKMIIPGADVSDLERAKELTEMYTDVYMSVGMHPYHHIQFKRDIFEGYVGYDKCVAIGECGLDYFRLPDDEMEKEREVENQKRVFIEQIKLSNEYKKPLIVHIREANQDSLDILESYFDNARGGVLHCFNASEILLRLEGKGFLFWDWWGLTFKNAKKLVEVLPKIALDRIVIETDAPYLTPHPHRGTRNEPKYTRLVVERVAEILDRSVEEIEDITTDNANRLFFS